MPMYVLFGTERTVRVLFGVGRVPSVGSHPPTGHPADNGSALIATCSRERDRSPARAFARFHLCQAGKSSSSNTQDALCRLAA
jgi:hypothetical protein